MTTLNDAPRYHITEKGNTGICRAQWSCKRGNIDTEHFDSREEAIAWRDRKASRIAIEPVSLFEEILKKIQSSGMNLEIIRWTKRYVETSKLWSNETKEDLSILSEIQEILSDPTPENITEAKKLLRSMNGVNYSETRFMSQDKIFERRDRAIKSITEDVIEYAIAGNYVPMQNAPERKKNTRLFGLDEARIAAVTNLNMLGYDEKNKRYYLAENVESYIEDTLNRIAAGEVYDHELVSNSSVLYPARDENKLMAILSNKEDCEFSRRLYLMTVFPDNELREAFENANIENVSVSFAPNCREDGLAYTVIQPNGDARTFGVFEHRNSDSIIISGTTNWDGSGGSPRHGNSKENFFAEFAPDDRKQAADALAFFIKSAQKGELESDEILEATVERRDWIAIISESIPSFRDWAEQNGYISNTTREEKLFGEGIHFPTVNFNSDSE